MCSPERGRASWKVRRLLSLLAAVAAASPELAHAQYEDDFAGDDLGEGDGEYEEPSFSANGLLKLQTGVFVPLISDGFSPHENEAERRNTSGTVVDDCDPVITPTRPCYPTDHGQKPGSPSMARTTLQLEAHWQATTEIALHGIFRGVRSLELPSDRYAQVPEPAQEESARKDFAMGWVRDNHYTETELRELYLDLEPYDFLALRIGRQQVAWGETGQYRLLDVVNPIDNTWHFGALETFEDTRMPLWMVLTSFDIASIESSLELLWIPLVDDPEDTVSVPLTFAGAWGLPYPNTPSPFLIDRKVFDYPGGRLSDMRAGARWKGPIGNASTYSLVYMYTHQLSPPVPLYFDQLELAPGVYDPNHLEQLVLVFPRQHIVGGSIDYTFESPLGLVARLEAAVEPDRTYPLRSTVTSATGEQYADPNVPGRFYFRPKQEVAVSYAVVLMRPTMLRFLNPTQNFLLVAQLMHTFVPTLDAREDRSLIEVPGYNELAVEKHQFRLVGQISTNYLHGLITPKLTLLFVPDDSGFWSLDMAFRLGSSYRANLTVTDFVGGKPYEGVGLFRDRDEVNASFTALF